MPDSIGSADNENFVAIISSHQLPWHQGGRDDFLTPWSAADSMGWPRFTSFLLAGHIHPYPARGGVGRRKSRPRAGPEHFLTRIGSRPCYFARSEERRVGKE